MLSSSNKRENTDLIDGAPSTGRDKIVSSDQTNTAEYLKLEGQKKSAHTSNIYQLIKRGRNKNPVLHITQKGIWVHTQRWMSCLS